MTIKTIRTANRTLDEKLKINPTTNTGRIRANDTMKKIAQNHRCLRGHVNNSTSGTRTVRTFIFISQTARLSSSCEMKGRNNIYLQVKHQLSNENPSLRVHCHLVGSQVVGNAHDPGGLFRNSVFRRLERSEHSFTFQTARFI